MRATARSRSPGGAVSADATEIASASGSVSSITITGAGSVFDAGTSFKVGGLGSGSLNLLADGVLRCAGGAGTLIVAGTAGGSGAEYRQRRRSGRAECERGADGKWHGRREFQSHGSRRFRDPDQRCRRTESVRNGHDESDRGKHFHPCRDGDGRHTRTERRRADQ